MDQPRRGQFSSKLVDSCLRDDGTSRAHDALSGPLAVELIRMLRDREKRA